MNSHELRPLLSTIVIYALLVLLFTLISLFVSPAASRTGVFRQVDAIPAHLALLAAGGVLLSLLTYAVYRRFDLNLAVLIPSVVILTDLDHLPSALGIAQSVRPAHSILLVGVAFVVVATIIRRLDFSFAVMAGFFAHVGIDTGIFAPFSPLSFTYYTITDYRWGFLGLAVVSALAAGYLAKRRTFVVK